MKKEELCSQLIQHLKDELKIHQLLLETVQKEKEFLISANLDEIKKSTESKEKMISKINEIEVSRDLAARLLIQELKITTKTPRLRDIIQHIGGAQALELKSLHSALELYVNRLIEVNEQNGSLIESALENIKGALGSIKGTLSEASTYKQKGKVEAKTLSGQFVSKEA